MPIRQRLLILGSGFAAFRLLEQIDTTRYDVTVLSKRNHFLFTPLLPSTAVGTLEFRTIIEPVRRARRGVRFLLGQACSLDLSRHVVHCASPEDDLRWEEPFDFLAIGVGAENNTFGIPGVREHCLFLKELADARLIRERTLGNLERACLPSLPDEERTRLLHFVAVGAGPTGVRFAAELHDLLMGDLRRAFPQLAGQVRVTLVEAGKNILGAFDESLRSYTINAFQRKNIVVRTDTAVAEVGPGWLRLKDGEVLPAGLILWSTGFTANAFVAGLPFEKERGRLVVDDQLQIPGQPTIYAMGDCACPKGQSLPQLAQVAEQQGKYVGTCMNRRAQGQAVAPFVWRNLGFHSYIGGGEAVMQSGTGKRRFAGFLAYQLWRSALFTNLVSVKNKVLVPLSRLQSMLFGRDLSKF